MTYPNARDCEHGRQRGKCPECDCDEADNLITKLESANARLHRIIDRAIHEAYQIQHTGTIIKILNEANVKEDK